MARVYMGRKAVTAYASGILPYPRSHTWKKGKSVFIREPNVSEADFEIQ
jgi:hypothetical protein